VSAIRERAEAVRFRAEEEAAHVENERRDTAAKEARWKQHCRDREVDEAAAFVAEFLEEPFGPERLTRLDLVGWKQVWAFDLPEFGPMQVRLNNFFGLRLMDGTRKGDGRLVRIIADLIEPTSSESRYAAYRDSASNLRTPSRPAGSDAPKPRRRWRQVGKRRSVEL
jgi:hypothetical protein